MTKIPLVAALFLTALCGCDEDDRIVVPAAVRELSSSPFPADEKIHVREKGRFVIGPKTIFCTLESRMDAEILRVGRRGVGIDGPILSTALEQIGQSPQVNGVLRQRAAVVEGCPSDGETVYIRGEGRRGSNGRPYRLIISAWQGDPNTDGGAWVGSVEQVNGKIDDLEFTMDGGTNGSPIDPAIEERLITNRSISEDGLRLSRAFAKKIIGDEK